MSATAAKKQKLEEHRQKRNVETIVQCSQIEPLPVIDPLPPVTSSVNGISSNTISVPSLPVIPSLPTNSCNQDDLERIISAQDLNETLHGKYGYAKNIPPEKWVHGLSERHLDLAKRVMDEEGEDGIAHIWVRKLTATLALVNGKGKE